MLSSLPFLPGPVLPASFLFEPPSWHCFSFFFSCSIKPVMMRLVVKFFGLPVLLAYNPLEDKVTLIVSSYLWSLTQGLAFHKLRYCLNEREYVCTLGLLHMLFYLPGKLVPPSPSPCPVLFLENPALKPETKLELCCELPRISLCSTYNLC